MLNINVKQVEQTIFLCYIIIVQQIEQKGIHMDLGEIIKSFRSQHNMSMDEFAKLSGLSKAYISMLEKNKDPRSKKPIVPSIETIKKVANTVGLSFDEVLLKLDKNYKISVNNNQQTKKTPSNLLQLPETKIAKIPILGEIACGEPITATQNIESYREELVDRLPKGELFFLKCKGKSMEPTIPNGSYVLIKEQPDVEDGQIAAVLVDGDNEATLKRIKHQGNIIMLIADNPEYDPIVLSDQYPGRIIGKAVKISIDL